MAIHRCARLQSGAVEFEINQHGIRLIGGIKQEDLDNGTYRITGACDNNTVVSFAKIKTEIHNMREFKSEDLNTSRLFNRSNSNNGAYLAAILLFVKVTRRTPHNNTHFTFSKIDMNDLSRFF